MKPTGEIARAFRATSGRALSQGDCSIQKRDGGLGLGLFIAHNLMNAHGGTLEAASEGLNRGAAFTARFALDKVQSLDLMERVRQATSP